MKIHDSVLGTFKRFVGNYAKSFLPSFLQRFLLRAKFVWRADFFFSRIETVSPKLVLFIVTDEDIRPQNRP